MSIGKEILMVRKCSLMIIKIDQWNHSNNCTIIKEIKHEMARNNEMPRGVDNDKQNMCLSLSCFMW